MTIDKMETTGTKVVLWGSIGSELVAVVYDLRYMVLFSIVLILADLWWGRSAARKRYFEAKELGNATLMDKFRWHKSRAVRRTCNKIVDYMTYLVVGALFGLAIFEPMEVCSHVWTAAIGLLIGGGCEVASIIGHMVYVKMGVDVKAIDVWRALIRFFGRMIKARSQEIGDAVEGLSHEGHHHHHHDGPPTVYDDEQNMED